MLARKKPMELGQITHASLGTSTTLYLDRESKKFWAEFSDIRYSGRIAEDVEKQFKVVGILNYLLCHHKLTRIA